MKTKDFSFNLPERLIAQYPTTERSGARLMVLPRLRGEVAHHQITDLPELLPANAVVVLNTSRVRKARLFGRRPGRERVVECLLLESDSSRRRWKVMLGRAGRLRAGGELEFAAGLRAELLLDSGNGTELMFEKALTEEYLDQHGHVPLPPYIKRRDEASDTERYQTVFADQIGSAAAPTAGLHIDSEILARFLERGIDVARITLHVGLGTFAPVRAENVEHHRMHSEWYEVPGSAAKLINEARMSSRPVIAVGTTAVRTLESAWDSEHNMLREGAGTTTIFITPGYRFQAIDGLLTNFHTPESTLLMLVSAFAGTERVLDAYATAVRQEYRFFSYGDAMLIL